VGLGLTPCQARAAVGWARAENADYPASDDELRAQLYAALQKQYGGGPEKGVWVEAVFSADKSVVFCVVQDKVVGGRTETYFRSDYTLDPKGVTFSEPAEVKRRVVYEPASTTTNTKGEETMTPEDTKKVDGEGTPAPAANAAAAPVQPAPAAAPAANAAPAAAPTPPAAAPAPKVEEPTQNAEVVALQERVKAQDEKIARLEAAAAPAIAEQERERQTLITELAANAAVPFSEDELKPKTVDELRKLAQMAKGGSFAGRGGPRVPAGNVAEPEFAAPVAYFDKAAEPAKKE